MLIMQFWRMGNYKFISVSIRLLVLILATIQRNKNFALPTLSAALGTTIGDSTASTVNNVGQVEWNYLLHSQIAQWEKQIADCRNQTCTDQVIQKYLALSDQQQKNLNNVCVINYNAAQCENLRKQYFAMSETLTQTHFNKLGGTNYWLHVENENQQAESIWRNVALSNPNVIKHFGLNPKKVKKL